MAEAPGARGIVIAVLGSPRIERDGRPVTFDTRKAVALLCYLAVTARSQRRETLAALLWPDISIESDTPAPWARISRR